ncbi:MAG: sulfatase [Mameliella sp.]|nr:sulfatase [Phaeodactylibacter sp.]
MKTLKLRSLLSAFVIGFALISCAENGKKEKTATPPNVLFILADDFGWKDVSYNGSGFYETPNIDRIAKEGFSFTNGYANCQVCSPSRASIMLGTFPARHGITDWIGAKSDTAWRAKKRFNQLLPAEYERALPPEEVTMAEAFKEGGYQTFFAGKWHLGPEGSWPEDHGFDINKGGWDKGGPYGGYFSPWNNPKLANNQDGENLSMRLADETVNFISNNHPDTTGKPFFAFLSFYAVHSPIQTTESKWRKYRNKAAEQGIADKGYKMGHFLPIRQVQDNPIYAGLVESMDDAIGKVLNGLDELGLDDNTIVVFTSDNGGVAAGDAFSTSNLPLRAGKGYQYEGGIREPYLLKVPWLGNGSNTVDVPAMGSDFYPTLLSLTGLPMRSDQHKDGIDLSPALQGKAMAERPLIWHYPHYGNQGGRPSSIIRLGQWKLIHYYEENTQVLYDLEKDIEEQNDLADEYPEVKEQLHQQLFEYLKLVNARFPKQDPLYNAAEEEAYLSKIKHQKLPQLEQKRMNILSPDFDAGDWWGSQVIND